MQIVFGVLLTTIFLLGLVMVGPIIIVVFLFGLIAGLIARAKGRDLAGWWFYGTIIPVVAIPHALLINRDQGRVDARIAAKMIASGMKKCPACAEVVRGEALKCKHCGHSFEPATETP